MDRFSPLNAWVVRRQTPLVVHGFRSTRGLAAAPAERQRTMATQASTIWIGCSGGHLLQPTLKAPAREASDWVDQGLVSEVERAVHPVAPLLREAAARAWSQAALELHYGVLDGSRLTLELMGVGAPSELLDQCEAGCSRLTELATQAFSLASGYGGVLLAPRGVSSGAALRVSPQELATACWLEGVCAGGVLLQALRLQRQSPLESWVAQLNASLHRAATARQQLALEVIRWLLSSERNQRASLPEAELAASGPLDPPPPLAAALGGASLPACDFSLLPLSSRGADPWLEAQGLLSAAALRQLEADFRETALADLRRGALHGAAH